MKSYGMNRIAKSFGVALPLALGLTAAVSGCEPPSGDLTGSESESLGSTNPLAGFEAWRQTVTVDWRGMYIVEGDLPLEGEEELFAYYVSKFGASGALTAYTLDDGQISKWSRENQYNLTYCLDYTFDYLIPGQKQVIMDAFAEAEADWEATTEVDFRHIGSEDGWYCNPNNENVLYYVTMGTVKGGRASAFRPHNSKENRVITISKKGLSDHLAFIDPDDGVTGRSLTALLKHELGHVLGFDHEHDWSLDEECADAELDNRELLTPIDTASVMWYPNSCESTHNGDYALTDFDRMGAMCNYTRNLSAAVCSSAHNGDDYIWWNQGAGHTTQALSLGGLSIPLSGDFDGDGIDDILWYGRGSRADSLWWGTAQSFVLGAININGHYDPFVGDFNGDGRDDIFWYGPLDVTDTIWWGRADRTFDHQVRQVTGVYEPIVADFDGNGCDDVFWYRAGSGTDALWYFLPNKSIDSRSVEVNGTYRVAAGDFDGDGFGDILWHQPGSGGDAIWYGRWIRGAFAKQSKTVNGDYFPFTGDFDGDGHDEIFWYGAGQNADVIWNISDARSASSTYLTVNGHYSPFTGDFDGDGDDDIFWYAPL